MGALGQQLLDRFMDTLPAVEARIGDNRYLNFSEIPCY